MICGGCGRRREKLKKGRQKYDAHEEESDMRRERGSRKEEA